MKTIGPFELLDEIGRGAMGVVYRAKDPAIGRLVAIKLIRLDAISDSEDDEFLRGRLLREAQSAGVLSHPGIVTIYQIAQENDIAYIAMEFVNGPTLEKLIGPGSPPLDQQLVRDILSQAATALDYAHRRGVIHRDVKPANIMIGEDGEVKICDFGVAKVFGGQKTVTRAGYVLGTPYYMSAEQIQGKPLDGRADQYSLAVIAYRILTGARPFDADSMETLLFQIIFGEPSLAHELNRSLPVEVGEVLKRGLAKKPEDRFPTCKDFADALLKACDANPSWTPATAGAAPAGVQIEPPPTPGTPLHRVTDSMPVPVSPPPPPVTDTVPTVSKPLPVFVPAPGAPPPLVEPAPPWWKAHTGALAGILVVAAVAVGSIAYWKNRPTPAPPVVSTVVEQPPPTVPQPPVEPPKPVVEPAQKKKTVVEPPPKVVPPPPTPKIEVAPPKPTPQETVPPPPPPIVPKETPRRRAVVPLERFTGALEGTLTCPGEFAPSSTVVIDDSRGCSGRLPDVAAELNVKVSPPDVSVVEHPTSANQFQRLVLRMPTRRVPSVTIRWEVK